MEERIEWFPFHVGDFLADEHVIAMTAEEVGAHMLLMCFAWRRIKPGYLPHDASKLQKLAKLTPEAWDRCKKAVLDAWKVTEDGSEIYQSRLVRTAEEQRQRLEKSRAGAAARWSKDASKKRAPSSHQARSSNAMPVRVDQSREEKIKDPEEDLPDSEIGDRDSKPGKLELVPTEPAITDADLESAYKLYPRKEGKSEGLERLAKQIKTHAHLAELKRAIANYAEQQRLDGTEPKYMKHFSTFVSTWRDWIGWAPKARGSPARNGPRPVGQFPEGVTYYTDEDSHG